MYKISDFLNANSILASDFVNINNEIYKIKKLNKIQEDMIYNHFEEIVDNMNLFVPTMYSLIYYKDIDELKDKLINTFKDSNNNIKELELKLAKTIFKYVADRGCMLQGSIESGIVDAISTVDKSLRSSNFLQLYSFIRILQERNYKFLDIKNMSSFDIIKTAIEEVIFSDNIELLKYLINNLKLDNKNNEDVIKLLELYSLFHPSKSNIIEEIVSELTFTKQKNKPLKATAIITDENGNQIDLNEVDKAMSFINNN